MTPTVSIIWTLLVLSVIVYFLYTMYETAKEEDDDA